MDLLHNAYSTASDDDDEVEEKPETKHQILPLPSSKRPKPDNPYSTITTSTSLKPPYYMPPRHSPSPNPNPNLQTEAPVPGRYVSKRERALFGSSPRVSDPNPNPNPSSTPTSSSASVFGSISDSSIPHDIMSSLRHQREDRAWLGRISERLTIALRGHSKAVNAIHWSPSHAHLLASAGMDHTICIWNVWSRDQKKVRVLSFHNAAVKDVRWSQQGLSVLSCGYDCSSRLVDIEKGIETQVFMEDQVVGVIKFHPDNCNLFLSGGAKGHLRLWDIRTSKVVHEYIRSLGSILDVEFAINGRQFISSSDVSRSNVSENSIIVWDVSRQVPLSNQVYVEAYTCPCVRRHPFDPFFVAQSNANYIAIFSSSPPFKLDKYKRSSKLVRKIKAYEEACIDVAFHPIMPNVIASCSWNGDVSIFE
ncbi:uncharacterized protein LOC112024714 isoform X2 [Quercus suber]|uniref:uncharacterized protein LOC112024714 isoform X2 n=1 Tax=Quercus suber TaxID=58331 RepID=UPI000CE1B67E|nr:WD repeat-containing protein 25 isoform X2 [Quercus suber]POF09657.1 wd repeat-containing protein 25 [Quercus suber]